jgi:hypothetical protein
MKKIDLEDMGMLLIPTLCHPEIWGWVTGDETRNKQRVALEVILEEKARANDRPGFNVALRVLEKQYRDWKEEFNKLYPKHRPAQYTMIRRTVGIDGN